MTIDQAIAKVNRLRPNDVDHMVEIGWLESVDKYVYYNVIKAREGGDEVQEPVYISEGNGDARVVSGSTVLLVPAPWDECYVFYSEAQIFYEQREIKKYASAMQLYNQAMGEFMAHYFRLHRQLGDVKIQFD